MSLNKLNKLLGFDFSKIPFRVYEQPKEHSWLTEPGPHIQFICLRVYFADSSRAVVLLSLFHRKRRKTPWSAPNRAREPSKAVRFDLRFAAARLIFADVLKRIRSRYVRRITRPVRSAEWKYGAPPTNGKTKFTRALSSASFTFVYRI